MGGLVIGYALAQGIEIFPGNMGRRLLKAKRGRGNSMGQCDGVCKYFCNMQNLMSHRSAFHNTNGSALTVKGPLRCAKKDGDRRGESACSHY